MLKKVRRFIKNILYAVFSRKRMEQIISVGIGRFVQFFIVQRIFRINGNVPWPVHWSSLVLYHKNIVLEGYLVFPGYQPDCYVNAANGINISNNVRIGPGVKLLSVNHDAYDFSRYSKDEPITISNNCWIGANAIILPGVTLGEHCIVAAGAVVNRSFEGNCVIAGVPGKIVKTLSDYTGDKNWGKEQTD